MREWRWHHPFPTSPLTPQKTSFLCSVLQWRVAVVANNLPEKILSDISWSSFTISESLSSCKNGASIRIQFINLRFDANSIYLARTVSLAPVFVRIPRSHYLGNRPPKTCLFMVDNESRLFTDNGLCSICTKPMRTQFTHKCASRPRRVNGFLLIANGWQACGHVKFIYSVAATMGHHMNDNLATICWWTVLYINRYALTSHCHGFYTAVPL